MVGEVFPALVEVGGDPAQVWGHQLVFLTVLKEVSDEELTGFAAVDF